MDDPVLSVLTVAGQPSALRRTYESLIAQTDRRWEWCLALDADGAELAAAGLPLDPRTKCAGGAEDPTEQLATVLGAASGRHVLQLAPGDLLSDDTVEAVGVGLPASRWGYTDEEQLFPSGRRDVWLKPEHSPELLRSQPYPVRSAVLPRAELLAAGGVRPAAGSAIWYDAVLRMSEQAGPALHLPTPHVVRTDPRQSRRYVDGDPAKFARVAEEHCRRVGIAVESVQPLTVQGRPVGHRVRRRLTRLPSVSIVVPTRGSTSVVRGRPRTHVVEMARSVWTADRYPDLELVVVYDADTPQSVLDELREIVGEDLVLCRYDSWFHFSRKCNVGATVARGEYVCFLNDDVEITDPGWLPEMVARLEDPQVGAVGARLLFEDGTLQHIGHQYTGSGAGHPLFGWRASTLALGAAAHVAGERSGVTAACLLMRAKDFFRLGGFSDAFPVNYNDVDLCLKLRAASFRIVFTPHAELFDFESQTRVARILRSETELLARRWGQTMRCDPYLRQDRPFKVRSTFLRDPAAAIDSAGAPPIPVPAGPDLAEETDD